MQYVKEDWQSIIMSRFHIERAFMKKKMLELEFYSIIIY